MTIVCLAMLGASAVWTRGLMAMAEAEWMAAESLRTVGIEPRRIFGSTEWNLYHGAFDDYLVEIGGLPLQDSHEDFWLRWYPQRRKQSQFLIVRAERSPVDERWELVRAVPYRDGLFRLKHLYVVSPQLHVVIER